MTPPVTGGCSDSLNNPLLEGETPLRGTGTPLDPYIICNAALFEHIRDNTSAAIQFYKLEEDIDFQGTVFEPLGVAKAECSDEGSFKYYFDGNNKRLLNYKLPISRDDYYHPTDRLQDIFGRCVINVSNLTVNPGSTTQGVQIEFCDLFDLGASGGDIGLTLAEEQNDGSFTSGAAILCSVGQLQTIDTDSDSLSKNYILYKDLDLENVEYSTSIIDGNFMGTFDGNHKFIRNLTINSSELHTGFFTKIQAGGTVKNLKFENVNIKSTSNAGSAEQLSTTTLRYVPSSLGVLAGAVREGHVINCSVIDNDADIDIFHESTQSSGVTVGGLVGYGAGLSVEDSFAQNLTIKIQSAANSTGTSISVGGLVGDQTICAHKSSSATNCSIGTTANIVGKMERSYAAYLNFQLGVVKGLAVGGLIGQGSFDESTFEITDSYAWDNSYKAIGSEMVANIGGLMGETSGSFFGQGNKNSERIYAGDLKIINSYASRGYTESSQGRQGGLLGFHGVSGEKENTLFIENSFSNMPFVSFLQPSLTSGGFVVGGIYGGVTASSAIRDISESYYAGKIICGTGSRNDTCGGLAGETTKHSHTENSDLYITVENTYSAAEIQQATASNRRDNIGLLFSADYPMVNDNFGGGFRRFDSFNAESDVADNPSLYFRRNGIVTPTYAGLIPGTTGALKKADQPCYIALTTPDADEACLGLAADPEDGITAGNRAFTLAQMQSVPSDPTVATGTSPAMGNEFLYTNGWCPRVCRDGESSCTETSNTLVGFDEDGNPLLGPGGGLAAQAQNEGRNCFEPCFEFEGNSSGVVSNTINGYRCEVSDVEIPKNTTSILADAFKDKNITSITFPESLVSIGNTAFSGNQLVNIIIPSSVTSIGDNAFSNNSILASVCVESQESSVALGTTPFGSLASSAIDYQTDGDCSN